jgi:hypothetical protein
MPINNTRADDPVSCGSKRQTKVLFSKKYGIDLVRFTRDKNSILSASKNDWDRECSMMCALCDHSRRLRARVADTIRYMSVRSNTYIRYFKGHRDRVVSLALSPESDLFLSGNRDCRRCSAVIVAILGALDDSVRLWDLRRLPRSHERCTLTDAHSAATHVKVSCVDTGDQLCSLRLRDWYAHAPYSHHLTSYACRCLRWRRATTRSRCTTCATLTRCARMSRLSVC